jgi:hypothetical protein
MAKLENKKKWLFTQRKGAFIDGVIRNIDEELLQYEEADLYYDKSLRDNKLINNSDLEERRKWRDKHVKDIRARIIGLLKAAGKYDTEFIDRRFKYSAIYEKSKEYEEEYEKKFNRERYIS